MEKRNTRKYLLKIWLWWGKAEGGREKERRPKTQSKKYRQVTKKKQTDDEIDKMPFITIREAHFQTIKYKALAKVKIREIPQSLSLSLKYHLERPFLYIINRAANWYFLFLLRWGLIMSSRLAANSRV